MAADPGGAGFQAGLVDNTAAEIINTGAADAWLGPMEKEISNLTAMNDEELTEWLSNSDSSDISDLLDSFGDSEQLRELLENEIFAAAADGILKKTKELKNKNHSVKNHSVKKGLDSK